MKDVLIVIASDPRSSGRPAEALRVAAGLGGWGKIRVTVCLAAAAAQWLEPQAEVEQRSACEEYLDQLKEMGVEVLRLLDSSPALAGEQPESRRPPGATALGDLVARHAIVIRF